MTDVENNPLEVALGYSFSNKELLVEALTHSSFRNENKEVQFDNERLEFLGDALIDAVISRVLWEQFPLATEGVLTRFRSSLVSESALFARGQELQLGASLFLGRGESSSGGRERSSVVSSAFEAVMAAVYLDGGEGALESVLKRTMSGAIDELNEPERSDYKTRVQEVVQARRHCVPSYRLDREEGPDHQKLFFVSLLVGGKVLSSGSGRSKKEASQSAAESLLGLLKQNPSLLE